ncbi:MAG: energy transducer TonB [Crocinitomicaceae bacterium]|nr:energy transducer TonB [Crocinitomicaceae bacterium]
MKRFAFLFFAVSLFSCEESPTGKSPQGKTKELIPGLPQEPEMIEDTFILEVPEIVEKVLPPPPVIEIIEVEEEWEVEEEVWIEEVPEEIIIFPDVKASYPGGSEALIKFINRELEYPRSANRAGIGGTVFVRFNIDLDGSIYRVQVHKGVHEDLDREAIRVIKRMNKWNPEEKNGRRVISEHTIPITFYTN